jgi:hypothetical protein
VPSSITEPRKGKWWDENEGKWIETNLENEKEGLKGIPDDNSDVRFVRLDVRPLASFALISSHLSGHPEYCCRSLGISQTCPRRVTRHLEQ